MDSLITLAVTGVVLIVAWVIGSSVESSHFRRLIAREQTLSKIMVSNLKRLPPNWCATSSALVAGEAVIATDYFKVFAASLRKLFGGRVRSYETLVERARREAIVRMLEQARSAGANAVWNVRIETTTIQGKQQGKSAGVEVLAYGTALVVSERH
ncbi:MAG: heavy metal-binding domain-containing protein [Candidatus Nealsonbacteria bacterium]|nr:heavy metal-binding domain-containing protein [Candidatus Nealsonbacteria bacterium]